MWLGPFKYTKRHIAVLLTFLANFLNSPIAAIYLMDGKHHHCLCMNFMRYTYALLFSLLATLGSAQVTMDQTFHDFGEITKGHMRLAEFNLMNNSDKKVLILRADQDPELDIRFSSKTVEPGAYATVRIQFNPRSRGRVNKKIDLWISTSQEPFVLEMEGIVKELETSFQPCPSFTHPDKIQPIQFNMTAFVTDMTTGLPLGNATIQMLRNGIALDVPLITNEQGKVSKRSRWVYTI